MRSISSHWRGLMRSSRPVPCPLLITRFRLHLHMGNLHALTIAQAHDKLRSKEVSAEDLVKASVERIEAVDSKLNAVVHRNFDGALDEAKKIDSKGTFDHPLTGIPYLAKDVFCEEGIATTACSNILRSKDYKPPFDSTTTKRLKAAGAISL